jgi:perosamine synthetase
MTNIQASIGLAQLENIDFNLNRKRKIGLKYNNELTSYSDKIYFPPPKLSEFNNIYWIFGFTISSSVDLSAKKLSEALNKKGIESRPFFCPMSRQPIFKNLFKDTFPVSDYLYYKGLYLPSGIGNTDIEIDYVINELKQILDEF